VGVGSGTGRHERALQANSLAFVELDSTTTRQSHRSALRNHGAEREL